MAIRYEEPKKVIEPMFFVNPHTLVDAEVEMAFHETMEEVAKGEMDKAEIAVALKAVVDMASDKFAKDEAIETGKNPYDPTNQPKEWQMWENEHHPKVMPPEDEGLRDDTYVKP